MNNDKTRTITLTDRAPVRIREAEWPVIAVATGDSWGSAVDPARHSQASRRGELDEYSLRVRQHEDGRAIVYGVLTAALATGSSEDRREGELLEVSDNLAAAVRRVGERCELPDIVIRECIADLPAREL